jgi:4-hydroxy-tetrahydrodipicolinate synthase
VRELGDAHANIVAIKEAKPDLEKVRALAANPKVAVLCGEDACIADFMGLGAVGVIGVVNNVAPAKVAKLVRAALPGGDSNAAARLVEELAPLCRDLFLESNPVPVKTALALMRKLREDVRLPLAPMELETRAKLEATLRAWLDHRGRVEETAAALGIHPQTVRYRLNQLREAFGDRLEDPDGRFALELALRVR